MQSVTVRVPAADLGRAMTSMRQWLDLHQSEPTRFDCGKWGAEVVLSVAFSTGGTAEEFARQFGGRKRCDELDLGTARPADLSVAKSRIPLFRRSLCSSRSEGGHCLTSPRDARWSNGKRHCSFQSDEGRLSANSSSYRREARDRITQSPVRADADASPSVWPCVCWPGSSCSIWQSSSPRGLRSGWLRSICRGRPPVQGFTRPHLIHGSRRTGTVAVF